jgi:cell wall-associated NlpC family hydrolase
LTAVGPPAAAAVATVVVRTAWLKTSAGSNRLQATFGTTLPVVDQRQPGIELGLPAGQRLWVDAAEVAVHQVGTPALPGTGEAVIGSARLFLGLPYVWGGTSGFGVDCSGLVYLVYRTHGTELPRDAEPQSAIGTSVALSALRPGDLVFFARDGVIHHVAIWIGAGQIIEAPQVGVPVRVVALASVSYASELSIAQRVLSPTS